jgi:hypothetical protein
MIPINGISARLYFVLSFLDIATMDPDPCPSDIKNSDIGKYIFNQPILSLKRTIPLTNLNLLNTETSRTVSRRNLKTGVSDRYRNVMESLIYNLLLIFELVVFMSF